MGQSCAMKQSMKGNMRNTLLFSIVILFGLISCYFLFGVGRSIIKVNYGRLIYSKYMERDKLKWEGGSTRLAYAEICRDDGTNCFGGKRLSVLPQKVGSLVAARNESEIHFFDSGTGSDIICVYGDELRKKIKAGATMSWLSKGRLIVVSQIYDEPYWNHQVVLFDTNDKPCAERTVFNIRESEPVSFVADAFSPDGSSYAWITCLNGCTMFWLNDDIKKVNSRPISCNPKDIFNIAWKGSHPMAMPFPNANAYFSCRDHINEG